MLTCYIIVTCFSFTAILGPSSDVLQWAGVDVSDMGYCIDNFKYNEGLNITTDSICTYDYGAGSCTVIKQQTIAVL